MQRTATSRFPARSFVLWTFWLALVLASCLAACVDNDRASDQHSRTPGVSDSTIRLGSSLVLTGHTSYLGIETLRGALSYFKYVNDTGGVHGRHIDLIARDDGYDPPRCLTNTQSLLIDGDIFALTCYVGTPTIMRILPLIAEARIPLVGACTGANALHEPPSRYVFNVRASYYQETAAAVRYLVEDLGLKRIAVFYQYDAYGFDGLTGTELALRERGLAPVARGSYARGTTNVDEALRRILYSGAQAVVLVGTYEPTAAFIRKAEAAGMKTVFHALSFNGAEELARLLGDVRSPVTLSQVVPPPLAPEASLTLGWTTDYVNMLARYFPGVEPSAIGLEGYINARILVEGLRRAGRDLTREKFVEALESIRDYPLGGSTHVTYTENTRQGMNRVYFTRLKNGEFEIMQKPGATPPGILSSPSSSGIQPGSSLSGKPLPKIQPSPPNATSGAGGQQ